jgi:hypothetical protein
MSRVLFIDTWVLLEVCRFTVGTDWLVFQMSATPPPFCIHVVAWLPSIITPSPLIPPAVMSLATGWMIKLLLFCIFLALALLVIIYMHRVAFTLILFILLTISGTVPSKILIAAVLQGSAIHLTFHIIIAL